MKTIRLLYPDHISGCLEGRRLNRSKKGKETIE